MRWFIGGAGAVVAVLLLLAGLAGCSAPGGGAAATATTGRQDVVAVVHELVRCARANGMPSTAVRGGGVQAARRLRDGARPGDPHGSSS